MRQRNLPNCSHSRSGSDRTRTRDLRRDSAACDDPLSSEGGSQRRVGAGNADSRLQQFFDYVVAIKCLEHVLCCVARRRGCPRVPASPKMYPSRTREEPHLAIAGNTICPCAGLFSKPSDGLEPSTPSLPWRFQGVTRVHARSLATQFFVQIKPNEAPRMRREASRVSLLMCPFCVRALSAVLATHL
jgi:hypothetical protein